MCALIWHVRRHHKALCVDPKNPTRTGGSGMSDCKETPRDNAGNLPQDDAEELPPLTGIWSDAGPGAAKNRIFALGDFALQLCKRFATGRSWSLQGAVYKQLAAKGNGEIRCLVTVQVLSHPTATHPTARSLTRIKELALTTVRDHAGALATIWELLLWIMMPRSRIALPELLLPLCLTSVACLTVLRSSEPTCTVLALRFWLFCNPICVFQMPR